jgi:hypothetical protein
MCTQQIKHESLDDTVIPLLCLPFVFNSSGVGKPRWIPVLQTCDPDGVIGSTNV